MSTTTSTSAPQQKKVKIPWSAVIALLPLTLIIVIFFALPILGMVGNSLIIPGPRTEPTTFGIDNYVALAEGHRALAAQNSLVVSLASATIAAVIGFIVAWGISFLKIGWLDQVTAVLSSVLANSGGAALAFSFIVLVGNAGYLTALVLGIDPGFSLYSVKGLILMYQYFLIPTMVLLALPSIKALRESWREANTSLGGTSWVFWRRVGMPILMPTVIGAWVLLIGSAYSTHASAAVLLGAGTFPLLTLQIANELSGSAGGSQNTAMAMGVVTMLVAIVTLVIFNWLQRRSQQWLAN